MLTDKSESQADTSEPENTATVEPELNAPVEHCILNDQAEHPAETSAPAESVAPAEIAGPESSLLTGESENQAEPAVTERADSVAPAELS